MRQIFTKLTLLAFFVGTILMANAQTYINGTLSTGPTSQSGIPAPAGTTWSEVANNTGNTTESNTSAGSTINVGSFTLADDFIVPAGQTWNISKFSFFAYQTGSAATPSPFTGLFLRVFNGNPSAGGTVVFGDLTTNRLSASVDPLMYRIFNSTVPPPGTAPGTTRKIWRVEANVTLSLPAGTYWVEWGSQVASNSATAHFAPANTVAGQRTTPGANALQKNVSTSAWTPVIDAGNPATAPDVPLDFPFQINYTLSGGSCSPTVTSHPADVLTCAGVNTSFTVAATSTTSPISYKWQLSTNGGGTYSDVPNAAPYSNVTSPTLNITGVTAGMTGYRYRCVVSSPTCTDANSNAAILTVSLLPAPTVNPSAPTICLGDVVQLSVASPGTTTFGPQTSVTVSSPAALNLTVPDNNLAGVTTNLTVAGIPPGSQIDSIQVNFNMTHTWDGDMSMNFRAPNNQVVNLIGHRGGSGDNFVNTTLSPNGLTLAGAVAPFTNIYRPDYITTAQPTVMPQTTTNISNLYTVPNGTYTLAMNDEATGDVGLLQNWNVKVFYKPAIVVGQVCTWSPLAGLYTNAGATTAYTGTAVNNVYAKPTATSTYSLTYTAGGCNSEAGTVTVTVNTPPAITTQPLPRAACAGQSNAAFSVAATGSGLTYQWQSRPVGAPGWTNLANGANFSGVTTTNLTVIAPPFSMNGDSIRCLVIGAAPCAAVPSLPVRLTVNPLPVISLTAAPFRNLFPGLVTSVNASSVPATNPPNFTWFYNGNPIAGATNSSVPGIDVDKLGDYSVRVTDINGCINTSGILAIGDSVSSKVFIYPSPNKGQFQVRFYSVKGNANLPRNLTIYNEKGQRVLTQNYLVGRPYDRMDVDIRNHGKGVYRVELSDRNGQRMATGSVVVL